MRAVRPGQADGGKNEQPVRRRDGGHQPGRGPGLEAAPEQPAGPAVGLGLGARGLKDERPAGAAGARRRLVFAFR